MLSKNSQVRLSKVKQFGLKNIHIGIGLGAYMQVINSIPQAFG